MAVRRTHSISLRLTMTNMAVSAAALLVACAAFFAYDEFAFRRNLVENLAIQAQIIGANSITALDFDDPDSAVKTLSALKASPHIVSAGVFMPDRKPFAAYSRGQDVRPVSPPDIPPGVPQVELFETGRVSLFRPILFGDRVVGIVSIESDLGEIAVRRIRYAGIAAVVLIVSLLAAMIVSGRLRQKISEPLVRLAGTARAVSLEKNYSLRAEPTDQIEVSVLVDAFNEMLQEIQRRDAELIEAGHQLERRVEERTEQLEAANKELEAFSYSVSHDLRAPLRHIDGFATLLAERYGAGLDPAARRYLDQVRAGASNMGRLVDDLLNMARIGRRELVKRPTNLRSLVDEVIHDLQPEMQGRAIDWRLSSLPTLDCDPGLMKIALSNLLSNAVKYTRGTSAAIIEVECIEQGDPCVLRIRDNGAGFDQQYVHKLFGVFQRLHRPEEFEGTGVGLATVQRIVQKHGGSIWAEGEVGKGAAFFLRFAGSVRRA